MPTMVEVPTPPDPGLPDEAQRSNDGDKKPPFQDDSFDTDDDTIDPDFNEFEFCIIVGQATTRPERTGSPKPYEAVEIAINHILSHFPDVTIRSHITGKAIHVLSSVSQVVDTRYSSRLKNDAGTQTQDLTIKLGVL